MRPTTRREDRREERRGILFFASGRTRSGAGNEENPPTGSAPRARLPGGGAQPSLTECSSGMNFVQSQVRHVVDIITIYQPDLAEWETDLRTRMSK